MKTRTLIVFVLLVGGLLAWRVWSRREALNAPPVKGGDLAVIVDTSSSVNVDCAQVGGLVRTGISEITVGRNSQLAVYVLGSAETAYEPVPKLTMHIEKGAYGAAKAARKAEQVCHSSFPSIPASSIFRALEVILNQIQSSGASARVILSSDLEETVDEKRLFAKRSKNKPLNNTNVAVEICGTSNTNDPGGPRGAHANALEAAWRRSFVAPIKIEPFCLVGQRASN